MDVTMTSTLPNFPASAAAASTVGTGILNSAHQSGLPAESAAHTASGGTVTEFAALLPGGHAPAASVTIGTAAPTIMPAGEGSPTPTAVADEGITQAITHAFIIPGQAVSANAAASVAEGAPVRPHGISLEEYEHAAAFVAALLQSLQTAAPVPTEPGAVETPSVDGTGVASAESADGLSPNPVNLVLPNGRTFPTELPAQAKAGFENRQAETGMTSSEDIFAELVAPTGSPANLVLPNGRPFPTTLPAQAKAALDPAPVSVAVSVPETASIESPVAASAVNATTTTPVAAAPAFEVAADGTIECTVRPLARSGTQPETALTADASMEVEAELETPGRAVVRVSAELPMATEHTPVTFERPENFAAPNRGKMTPKKAPTEGVERNFVFTGDKQVKTDSPLAGITVAKTENTMPVVPTEEPRSPRNPETLSALPVRADFQVVQPTAERITVEPAAPAGQNFAERAVATVTSLAEAQFSASMQRAGSVQLRLKFGGEDLTVRVELREGVVRTDFRTDSPALREALAKEWQAVAAASPGLLQRFLDPVFSPASSSGSLADAGAQHQSAHRQAQQQAQQEQSAHRAEAWASASPFSRRSALSESFVPEPAAPRVPVLLPTSLRLSALA
jgi:hypothetical protein